jgi:hypothetical protein
MPKPACRRVQQHPFGTSPCRARPCAAQLEPVTLELRPGGALRELLTQLGVPDEARRRGKPPVSLPGKAAAALASVLAGSGRTTEAGSARGGDGGAAGAGPAGLCVSLSRTHVTFDRSGALHTRRTDMLLGAAAAAAPGSEEPAHADTAAAAGSGAIRVAVWGSADLSAESLSFTLGLDPGPLLSAMGCQPAHGLPPGYLLLVPVGGSPAAPTYQVVPAALRLAQLAARAKVSQEDARDDAGGARGEEEGAEGERGARRRGPGAIARGFRAAVSLLAPEEDLQAALDAAIAEDLARTPPPPADGP